MPGMSSVADLADATDAGRTHFCSFRKIPSQTTIAGWWNDLSMASGNPLPNYYASSPLEAATLNGFRGIFHGDDKTPASKHLTSFGVMSPTAGFLGQFMLLDYLLYYPFVDGDSTDAQMMVNDVAIPRYTDGEGVQVMAVAVAPTTGSGQFTFDYVNQDGNTVTSPVQICSTTAANISNIVTSQQAVASIPGGPFLKLNAGDTGVRSIISATFTVPNGGLLSLVLIYPLASFALREINTMNEVNFVRMRPGAPTIKDDAYLNLIVNTPATIAAGTLAGYATFAWSDD